MLTKSLMKQELQKSVLDPRKNKLDRMLLDGSEPKYFECRVLELIDSMLKSKTKEEYHEFSIKAISYLTIARIKRDEESA